MQDNSEVEMEQAAQPQIEELSDSQQVFILNEHKQDIPKDQLPQKPDEQQPLIDDDQRPNPLDEQIVDAEQNVPQQDDQQPLIENNQIPNTMNRQERLIPDEVRQMPDAQQQQMLREIFRQELHQFQRIPKNNNTTLISILLIICSILAAVVISILFRPPIDYVSRHEFDAFKMDNQNGLVAVRENSKKSISEHEAKIAKFGKHWEEMIKNIMKPNITTKELPDYSIANLLEADRKVQAEIFKLTNELSDLKTKFSDLQSTNIKMQRSLDSIQARLQKIESLNETGWFDIFKSFMKHFGMSILSVAILFFVIRFINRR